MVKEDLKHLYEWSMVDRVETNDEGHFLEYELYFAQYGMKTKVVQSEDHMAYEFWVPMKDYEVVRAFYTGEVTAIHTLQREVYQVFHEDLTFKNDKLYENKYAVSPHYSKIRNLMVLAIVILVIWILARWGLF